MKKGFSLIEVLVFISILGLFFVVAIAVTTASLRNMKVEERKILATRHAEELIEWLKSEKEAGWSDFTASSHEGTFCFNSDLGNDWDTTSPSTGNCASFNGIVGITPEIFKRELILDFTGAPATQVNAQITVSWQESNGVQSIEQNATFSIWE